MSAGPLEAGCVVTGMLADQATTSKPLLSTTTTQARPPTLAARVLRDIPAAPGDARGLPPCLGLPTPAPALAAPGPSPLRAASTYATSAAASAAATSPSDLRLSPGPS